VSNHSTWCGLASASAFRLNNMDTGIRAQAVCSPSRARNYHAHVQVYGHDDDDSHSGYVRTSISSIRLSATLYQAALVGLRLH
jgi:hypothetical protein